MISKILQILSLQLKFQKFSRSIKHFFLTVGQNNFGNKIPYLRNKYLEVNWGLITMLLKLLEFTDSCVVFEAAVAPPIGVEPVVYLTEAHFSRLLIISKSVIVGCSVSNLCLEK